MDLLSYVAVGLLSIATLIYWYFKVAYSYWKSRNVPYLEPSFPYGNIKDFGKKVHSSRAMQDIYTQLKGADKFCGVYFFFRPIALILDLELVKNIMIKDFNCFNERGLYYNEKDDPLSAHLFALDGEKWKNLRSKLSPTFTSGKMKFMYPTIVEVGDRFRECLHEVVKDGNDLEIKDLLARFTTDVIGTCAFGIECKSLKDPNAEFRNMGRDAFEKPRHKTSAAIVINGFKNLSRKLGIKVVHEDVSKFFLKVVKDTVEYREKNNVARNDFMDLLIKLKNEEKDEKTGNLTLNEIAAQAFVFFLAGFETSSTTLTFCLYELALNPDIQRKTREEIRAALKRHGGEFNYEAMMDMTYVDQVLQETLRKYPPVSNLNRNTKNDYHVPGTKHVIQKGTSIVIPIYAFQHDPEIYPQPEKFDPDRFSSEEIQKRDAMAWLPFGDGPRNCIGLRFGMMQARVGLVTLLNNFEFSTCSQTKIPLVIIPKAFILSPEGGMYLNLKPIK